MHVHTAAQLEAAHKLADIMCIVVHPDIKIDPAVLGTFAVDEKPILALGPGVIISNITGGRVLLHATEAKGVGASATNITGGYVEVYRGCTASEIDSGRPGVRVDAGAATVAVHEGGRASKVRSGTVTVFRGGEAIEISGGVIYLKNLFNFDSDSLEGSDLEVAQATAKEIFGGTVFVDSGCRAIHIYGTARVQVELGGTATDVFGAEVMDRIAGSHQYQPRWGLEVLYDDDCRLL